MENFAERLKAKKEALIAKIDEAILKAKDAVSETEQLYQNAKKFAEDIQAEKANKIKHLVS